MNALSTFKTWCIKCIHQIKGDKPMLTQLYFNLTDRICPCQKNNIAWGIAVTTLDVWCKTCQTKLCVPLDKLRATITFDNPYPDGDMTEEKIIRIIK